MPAHDDPYIRDLIAKHYICPEPSDTDDLDAAVRATDAELRGIAVRQKVIFLWLAEHWTREGIPAAGTDFHLDAYIQALVHRHSLTRQAGENDAELAHRALACEVVAEAARAQMLADWTDAEAGAGRTSGIDSRARPPGRRKRPARDGRPMTAPRPSPGRPTTADPGSAQRARTDLNPQERHRMYTPTFSEIGDLPVSLDLPTAGRMLRIGRTRAYTMARTGTFPTRVIPTGAGFVVPTAEVLRLLGIDTATATGTGTGNPDTTDASPIPQIAEDSNLDNSDLT